MKSIKIKLVCKVKNSSHFNYEESYPVTIIPRDYQSLATVVDNDNVEYECSFGMLYNLFYNEQEWRDKQINKILL
jgi:hypothetical protein